MFMKIIRLTSHFRQRLQKPQKLRVKREHVVSTFFCSVCFGSILIPLTGEGSPWQPKSRMGVHVLLELNWTECLAPSYRIVLYEVIKLILKKNGVAAAVLQIASITESSSCTKIFETLLCLNGLSYVGSLEFDRLLATLEHSESKTIIMRGERWQSGWFCKGVEITLESSVTTGTSYIVIKQTL